MSLRNKDKIVDVYDEVIKKEILITKYYGNKISNNYNFEAPNGYAIVGFFGFAGDEIDRIGCIYQKL